jgi:hypothetical protein
MNEPWAIEILIWSIVLGLDFDAFMFAICYYIGERLQEKQNG